MQWEKEIKHTLGIEAGVIGSGKFDTDSIIVVANIQTLTKNMSKVASMFGTLIIDECLDYETMVLLADGSTRKIGALVNGKEHPYVKSFNTALGIWENNKVVRHFKSPQKTLLKITTTNGAIKCTENHSMYLEGLVKKPAGSLKVGDKLISYIRHKDSHTLEDKKLALEGFKPEESRLLRGYTYDTVTKIEEVPATGGNRYNIEVENNHNYVANGKLVANCHHTPASTFTKVVNISKAKYKIGLSGTVERKDGMHVILADYFSKTMYRPPRENMMMPTIYRIPTDIQFSDNAEVPWAHRVNDLFKQAEFFNLVVSTAAVQASRGHKVLVVSDRVQFLENCHEILSDNSICISGSIKSLEERERLIESIYSTHDIIFGTTSIFSEGISINPLSCLILTSPISNDSLLEQLIGRIVRVVPGKKTPEVLDFLLQGATAKRQATKRLGLYIKRGYKISELQQTKNKFDK